MFTYMEAQRHESSTQDVEVLHNAVVLTTYKRSMLGWLQCWGANKEDWIRFNEQHQSLSHKFNLSLVYSSSSSKRSLEVALHLYQQIIIIFNMDSEMKISSWLIHQSLPHTYNFMEPEKSSSERVSVASQKMWKSLNIS